MPGPLDLLDPSAVSDVFDAAAATLRGLPVRRGCTHRLPGPGTLLATGDLHDNPAHLAAVEKLAKLDAGPDRHVVLHELIHGDRLVNGMDFSHRMLARVAELVTRHPGQVHPMLANHELAQMTRRGVSKGAGDSVQLFDQALDFVYGDDAGDVAEAINRFFAAMPLAVVTGSGVLCAHSLPAARMLDKFDAGVLERDLTADDYAAPGGAAYQMVWGRGYTDASVETLATRWNVELFLLGHQHVETGIEQRGPRVIVLNSDHEAGKALSIDLEHPPDPGLAIMSAVPLGALLVLLMTLLAPLAGCGDDAPGAAITVPVPADWTLLPPAVQPLARDAAAACRESPTAETLSRLARLYHGNHETVLAAASYEAAIAAGSDDPRDAYLLGLIYEHTGDSDRALASLRRAIDLAPTYGPAHLHLGRARLDAGDIDGAIDSLQVALAIEPRDPVYHASLGAALRQAGRLEEAAASLEQALALDANYGPAHQLLGLTLQALGHSGAAAPHLHQLRRYHGEVVIDPWLFEVQRLAASLEARLDVAEGYLASGRYDSAVRELRELGQAHPDRAAIFRQLGRAYMGAGRAQDAVRAYVKATDLEPDEPSAHAALALILLDHDNLDDAHHEATLTLAADPKNLHGLMVQAAVAVKQDRPAEALAILDPLVERRSDVPAVHVWRGEALAALGRTGHAATAFLRALELDPTLDYARRRLGDVTTVVDDG